MENNKLEQFIKDDRHRWLLIALGGVLLFFVSRYLFNAAAETIKAFKNLKSAIHS